MRPAVRPEFREIDFGYASAGTEVDENPELLLDGFYDPYGWIDQARNSRHFIFLGYKGSGKSAIGEHLRLTSDHSSFARVLDIADIAFSTFSQIMKSGAEPEARYPSTWAWLLLVQILDSFAQDHGSNVGTDETLFLALTALEQLGLRPNPDLAQAVRRTADTSFGIKINTVLGSLEISRKTKDEKFDLPFFVDHLRAAAAKLRSANRHYLVIDGFDELLRRGHLQYDALGALIFEANRLNSDFVRNKVPSKIIVLCRTDLFERLVNPNKNKIRQDYALQLDWFAGSANHDHSPLFDLINQRARASTGMDLDVVETYLPELSSYERQIEIRPLLLNQTRHLPRDIIMLFRYLQKFASSSSRMTEIEVNKALGSYSRDYFLPEIRDELDGYHRPEHIAQVVDLLGSLRRAELQFIDVQQQAKVKRCDKDLNLKEVLRTLFECSAIGNVDRVSSPPTFKYISRHASFNPDRRIFVHRGLWKALNIESV